MYLSMSRGSLSRFAITRSTSSRSVVTRCGSRPRSPSRRLSALLNAMPLLTVLSRRTSKPFFKAVGAPGPAELHVRRSNEPPPSRGRDLAEPQLQRDVQPPAPRLLVVLLEGEHEVQEVLAHLVAAGSQGQRH